MRSRMENLLEVLPGLLTDNEAAQKYPSQYPFMEKRRIQQQFTTRLGNTDFAFREAAQEAITQALTYAYLDSRDPQRGDDNLYVEKPSSPSLVQPRCQGRPK